jgi:hypothetical protein
MKELTMNLTLTAYGNVDGSEEPRQLDSINVVAETINDLYKLCEGIEARLINHKSPRITEPLIVIMQWENGACSGNTMFGALRTYKEKHGSLVEQPLNIYNEQ